ncbi:MAG: bifunctional hydroxymethylpyrimidine kinase/phosphomethylpyrimidine kinase [Thermoleophilia bacterium]
MVLTAAGSDPGGGAGLQADLRVFRTLGLYGVSVTTAITAQNTRTVEHMFPLPPQQVRSQLEVLLADISPLATKTGMLATPEIVAEIAHFARQGQLGRLIIDPVLSSTSGQRLADSGLARDLVGSIIPLADLVTPNIGEATRLTGVEIRSVADMKLAAWALVELGARAVCITGGHLKGEPVDVLYDGKGFIELRGSRAGTPGDEFHGTGCMFSAAVTGYIARGMDLADAVRVAKKLVTVAIDRAIRPGRGMQVPDIPGGEW